VFQAIDEHRAVGGGFARAGRGQVDEPRDTRGQGGQPVGAGDVAPQPADAVRIPDRWIAAQRVDFVAARQETPGRALTQVASAV
jgi:hypothetical protein